MDDGGIYWDDGWCGDPWMVEFIGKKDSVTLEHLGFWSPWRPSFLPLWSGPPVPGVWKSEKVKSVGKSLFATKRGFTTIYNSYVRLYLTIQRKRCIYIYTYLWIQNHICADRRSMYVLEILALGERKHDHIGVTSCHIGDALMIGYVSPVSNRDEAKQLRMMRDQPQNIKTFHQASWIFSFWLLVKKLHLWGWIFPPPFKVPPTF